MQYALYARRNRRFLSKNNPLVAPPPAHAPAGAGMSAECFFIRGVVIPDDSADGGHGYATVDVTLGKDGKIAALVPTGTAPPPAGAIVVEGKHKLLLPGTVNAHTHTSEHWARGLIKPLPLELWIHQLVRRHRSARHGVSA